MYIHVNLTFLVRLIAKICEQWVAELGNLVVRLSDGAFRSSVDGFRFRVGVL